MGKSSEKPTKISPSYTVTQRTAQPTVGTIKPTPAEYLQTSVRHMQRCYKTQLLVRYRDKVYQAYGINRFEVDCLLLLSGLLENLGRQVISKTVFLKIVTGSFKTKAKFSGYLQGLLDKGCLGSYEYVSSPDSLAIGITDFGIQVMDLYFKEQAELFQRYINPDDDCPIRSIVIGEDLPTYKARQTA
ncbi:MAG TPA: hypothetical protein VL443_24065 [Cyclobacteriaceae bacterium]|nr:hypothetical protein [Cyclobacteriaceae bacterium]